MKTTIICLLVIATVLVMEASATKVDKREAESFLNRRAKRSSSDRESAEERCEEPEETEEECNRSPRECAENETEEIESNEETEESGEENADEVGECEIDP